MVTRILLKIFISLLVTCSTVRAQLPLTESDIALLDKNYQACLDKGQDMLGCTREYIRRMDENMGKALLQYKHGHDTFFREMVDVGQKEWLKKQETAFTKIDSSKKHGGRDDEMVRLDEKARFIRQRVIYWIKAHEDWQRDNRYDFRNIPTGFLSLKRMEALLKNFTPTTIAPELRAYNFAFVRKSHDTDTYRDTTSGRELLLIHNAKDSIRSMEIRGHNDRHAAFYPIELENGYGWITSLRHAGVFTASFQNSDFHVTLMQVELNGHKTRSIQIANMKQPRRINITH